MDIFDIYAILNKKITASAGGITGITVGADGASIDISYGAGGKDNVPFPNQLTQAQRQLVAKFSVDASGKLLFDGKEISGSGDMTIQDGSITANKLSDDAGDGLIGGGKYSANLFNKANVVNDKYLVENGTETSDANYSYGTDYIPVDMAKTYAFTGCYGKNQQAILYDENKTYVGTVYKDKCTGTAGKSVVCDFSKLNKPTAKYIRLNTTTNKLDIYMFVQSSTYPTEYIPFKYTPGGLKSSKLQSAIETIVDSKSSSLEGITIGETVNVNGDDQLIAIGTNTPTDTSLPAVAIGYGALQNNMTTGSDDTGRFNVAVGSSTLNANTTGNHNTAIGYQAMRRNTTGSGNTGIGEDACIANTTGNGNTGVGRYTLFTNSVGSDNVAVGLNASYLLESSKNTAVGVSAGRSNRTGEGNTYLGYYANGSDAITNATAIGNQAYVKESDAIQLGNSNVKKVYTWGDIQLQRDGAGIILLSPNGTKCKLTVSNDGKLLFDGKEPTDELVKMDNTSDAKYLVNLLDKQTVVNDNGVLKVKKLDGQEVTIAEINYLKGLTMNVMDLVNAFANGGVKVINTPVATAADLATLDRSKFIDGISYIVYVLADESHAGAKTTYLCDKTNTTFFGNADSQRNFTTNPINLANEVTGKLGTSNIDVDNLWKLLTIDDTYKTLTTTNNVFGTHGAKAMYDELTTSIGAKANATNLTTHTSDTDTHITTAERTKWNEVVNKANKTEVLLQDKIQTTTGAETHDNVYSAQLTKTELDKKANDDEVVKKTDISTTINSTSTDDTVPTNKAVYDSLINKVDNTIVLNTADEVNSFDRTYQSFIIEPSVAEAVGLPKAPDSTWFCINLSHVKGFKYPSQIAFEYAGIERVMYRTAHNGVWHNWKKIPTTSVADVPITYINTFENETYVTPTNTNVCSYQVINGICVIRLETYCKASTTQDFVQIFSGLPKPTDELFSNTIDRNMETNSGARGIFNLLTNGTLRVVCDYGESPTGGVRYFYATFSYPVAE